MSEKNDFSFSISKPSLLNLVSIVLIIVALLILLTTVSSNSWMTASDDGDDYLFGLSEIEESDKYTSYSRDYDSREWIMFDGEDADSAGTVALISLWIAILVVTSSLVLLCLNNLGLYKSNYAFVLSFTAGGLAIVGAIIWLVMFPEIDAAKEEDGLGPGSAFYLTIIAGLLSVGAGFSLLKSPETEEPIWMPLRRTFSEIKNSDQGNLDLTSIGLVLGAVLVLFVSLFTTSWMTGSEDDTSYYFGLYGMGYRVEAEEFTFTGDYSEPDAGEIVEDAGSAGTAGAIFLWIAAIVAISSLVLICLNNIGVYTSKYGMIAAFASGGLAILGAVIWLIMFSKTSFFEVVDLSPGISFYLAIIGGLSCIGAGACDLMSDRKQKV